MNLSEYLKREGLTDATFAEMIGVDRSSVTRMRSGKQIPAAPVMREIAAQTGGLVTANDFFGIIAEPRPSTEAA